MLVVQIRGHNIFWSLPPSPIWGRSLSLLTCSKVSGREGLAPGDMLVGALALLSFRVQVS